MDEDWEVVEAGASVAAPHEDQVFFSKTFGVPESTLVQKEMVLMDSMQGWLYVGRRHLCFVGGLIRKATLVIDLRDVINVREEPWTVAGHVISKSIVVSLSNGQTHNVSTVVPFSDARARLYRNLCAVWKASLEQSISLAETHQHSDVVDLLLVSESKEASSSGDMRRVKAQEDYSRIVRSNRFELVDVFRKGIGLLLENRNIVGSLYVGSCLAFESEHRDITFFFHLSLAGIVETDDPLCITFRMLQDEALVVSFRLATTVDPNVAPLVKGVWRSEFQRIAARGPSLFDPGLPVAPSYFSEEMLADRSQFSPTYVQDNEYRLKEWKNYLRVYGQGTRGSKLKNYPFFIKHVRFGYPFIVLAKDEFEDLVLKGIPDALRGEIWMLKSGAAMEMISQRGMYSQWLADAQSREFNAARDISKDVGRTLPTHPYFQSPEGLAALERVLSTYAYHNPLIGYTQSMNFLCAIFLLYMSEEAAFWMMSAMCERINPHMYRKSMVGSLAQLRVFERLLRERFANLMSHLDEQGFQVTMVATGWFMCLFISFLPWEMALRIVDYFFCVTPHVVYHVALALFMLNEQTLMEKEHMEDIIKVLHRRDYEAGVVMEIAHSIGNDLPAAKVEGMFSEELVKLARNISEAGEKDLLANVETTLYTHEELYQIYEGIFQASLKRNVGALQRAEFAEALRLRLPSWNLSEEVASGLWKHFCVPATGLVEFPQLISCLALLEKSSVRQQLECFLSLPANPRENLKAFLGLYSCVLPESDLLELIRVSQSVEDMLRVLQSHGIGANAILDSDVGDFEVIQ